MTPEERQAVGRDVFEMISLAVADEQDKAADKLTDLGERLDISGMYGVCCGVASVGIHAMTRMNGGKGPDLARGDMWALAELRPGAATEDPPAAFAARFMVALGNNDRQASLALFDTALRAGPERYVESVCALLAQTAGLCRLALKEQRGGS